MVTVKELIEILQKYPQDMEVVHTTGFNYTVMSKECLPIILTVCESKTYSGMYQDIRYADGTYNKDKTIEKVCI